MKFLKWLMTVACCTCFLGAVEAQQPKRQREVVGVFLGKNQVGIGEIGKEVVVFIIMMKDDEGRYLIFKEGKDVRITPNQKLDKNLLVPGAKIAVSLATNDTATIMEIDVRQEAKGKQEGMDWERKMDQGRYASVKNDFLLYEVASGQLRAVRLQKNTKISSGSRDENIGDIRPGRVMALFVEGGKLLGIAMLSQGTLADDGASLEKLKEFRVPFVREQTATTSLTVRFNPFAARKAFSPEVAAKVMADLGQMPGLRSLAIGMSPSASKIAPKELPIEDWSKASDEFKKMRSPFALDVRVDFKVGSDLSELKNLSSLTLVNPENRVDFASLKKLTSLQSLTLAVDNDADLAKAVSLGSLTGLILESDPSGKSKLTPAGMKSLKKATNLTDLIVRLSPTKDAITRDAALREAKDNSKLRTLVSSITPETAKEIKKNTKISSLTVSQADDACVKEICEMKGLLDLCLVDSPKITTAGLKHLKKLRILQRLDLGSMAKGEADEAMADISNLSSLITLKIPVTGSDAGMVPIKKLSALRHVYFLGPVSDKGIACLEELPDLEAVSLGTARMTGEGLRSLSKVKSLTWLHLPWRSPISPGGYTSHDLTALQKSRPNLAITEAVQPVTANFRELPDPFARRWLP